MTFRKAVALVLLIVTGAGGSSDAAAPATATPPAKVGACAFTRIRRVEQRLEDTAHVPVANSGSAVLLDDKIYGVSYDQIAAIDESRTGDRCSPVSSDCRVTALPATGAANCTPPLTCALGSPGHCLMPSTGVVAPERES